MIVSGGEKGGRNGGNVVVIANGQCLPTTAQLSGAQRLQAQRWVSEPFGRKDLFACLDSEEAKLLRMLSTGCQ